MDKLRGITFFCRTVEAKSFAAAAQSLDVVPSALSKTIAALERQVGFTLFNRSTRRLALTVEGAAYYRACRQLLAELEETEARARGGHVHPRGTLRVGMHPALRALVFPELTKLIEAHPDLNVETVITNSPTAVLDSGLDVVLRIGEAADSTLIARRVGWASFVLCASPDYIRRRGAPSCPRDLERHEAIIYARPDEEPNTAWTFTRGTEREVVNVRVRMIARDGIGLIDAGVGGAGVLRPYETAARRQLADGQLQLLLPDWSSRREPIYATFPNSRQVPAKVRAFVDFAEALLTSSSPDTTSIRRRSPRARPRRRSGTDGSRA